MRSDGPRGGKHCQSKHGGQKDYREVSTGHPCEPGAQSGRLAGCSQAVRITVLFRIFAGGWTGRLNKGRHVRSYGNSDAHRLTAAFVLKVIRQPPAQLARVIPDDIVFIGAIALWPPEHRNSEPMFGNGSLASFNCFSHDIQEELGEQRRPRKVWTRNYPLRKHPPGIVRQRARRLFRRFNRHIDDLGIRSASHGSSRLCPGENRRTTCFLTIQRFGECSVNFGVLNLYTVFHLPDFHLPGRPCTINSLCEDYTRVYPGALGFYPFPRRLGSP